MLGLDPNFLALALTLSQARILIRKRHPNTKLQNEHYC